MDTLNNLIHSNKNDILDPLSIIIKLFIYSYKPIGTKISIGNNRIYIQDNTIIQGVMRKINGDTKNDINILMCPVLYACITYLKSSEKTEFLKLYKSLFKIALIGLNNMKQTYSGTSIVYNIEHIINMVSSYIVPDTILTNVFCNVENEENFVVNNTDTDNNTNSLDDLRAILIDEPVITPIHKETPIFKIKENIYSQLSGIWTESRSRIAFGYIYEITENISDNTANQNLLKNHFLDALGKFMECIDIIVVNTLQESI